MDDLTYSLRQLCKRNKDGSHATQAERFNTLTLISKQLKAAGYRNMQATSLKEKHVRFLVEQWQQQALSTGTIKNRMAHLRWWAQKVNKAGVIPNDNIQLGIPNRQYVATENKAKTISEQQWQQVDNPHIKISLQLQQAFGLRREEAIKFQPAYADKGDSIQLKGSWTKGGKPREIPILTNEQRAVLDEAHQLVGSSSLIPADKSYIQQRNCYDGLCQKLGLNRMHGLRHAYAQRRYNELTGWDAPAVGGKRVKELDTGQQIKDRFARQVISRELGHGRLEVVKVYLGGIMINGLLSMT